MDIDITSYLLGTKNSGGGGSSKYAPQFVSFYRYSGGDLTYELENLDTSNFTSMAYMFAYCDSAEIDHFDLSGFDTSKGTVMNDMFNNIAN